MSRKTRSPTLLWQRWRRTIVWARIAIPVAPAREDGERDLARLVGLGCTGWGRPHPLLRLARDRRRRRQAETRGVGKQGGWTLFELLTSLFDRSDKFNRDEACAYMFVLHKKCCALLGVPTRVLPCTTTPFADGKRARFPTYPSTCTERLFKVGRSSTPGFFTLRNWVDRLGGWRLGAGGRGYGVGLPHTGPEQATNGFGVVAPVGVGFAIIVGSWEDCRRKKGRRSLHQGSGGLLADSSPDTTHAPT